MSYFILSPDVIESIESCRLYAEQPQHWYQVDFDERVPGEDPRHVLLSGTTKMVFSWTTKSEGDTTIVCRHLSVGVTKEGRYPPPVVVWTLASYFGFTGAQRNERGFVTEPAPDWRAMPNPEQNCVVVIQVVPWPFPKNSPLH